MAVSVIPGLLLTHACICLTDTDDRLTHKLDQLRCHRRTEFAVGRMFIANCVQRDFQCRCGTTINALTVDETQARLHHFFAVIPDGQIVTILSHPTQLRLLHLTASLTEPRKVRLKSFILADQFLEDVGRKVIQVSQQDGRFPLFFRTSTLSRSSLALSVTTYFGILIHSVSVLYSRRTSSCVQLTPGSDARAK